MHERKAIPKSLMDLGRAQSGIVTTTQITQTGLSRHTVRRLVDDRIWTKLDRGLYLLHSGAPSWLSYVHAGLALAGPDSYTTTDTAAALHGLTTQRQLPIHVAISDRRGVQSRAWLQIHRPTQLPSRLVHSGPARPPIHDVVLDMCAASTPGDVAGWIYDAVGSSKTTPAILLATLGERGRIANRDLIYSTLLDVRDGINSHLEYDFLHRVERPHGLPPMTRQFVVPETGRRADGAYEEFRLLIELDGEQWHTGQQVFRDRERDNRHSAIGWRSMRFGRRDIHGNPCGVARDVATDIGSGGWAGKMKRCARCP
ncbi:uncharacterized protein DUF559 [Antricoccus suffuscus]|uniref:Uncharacterized protein DUF559 n=1 Tax=Antricoccus suffuscus TaxID=1629062 RepID=A0A2T1A3L6_9ACTN|nr:type IV toxin-antitoxin system AbiEi family antitoxin domain-containing protein [Antricoccus suffuscus]PRZ43087.1 uncharacterized protein DUF559 [Antricoccus suffuscus]